MGFPRFPGARCVLCASTLINYGCGEWPFRPDGGLIALWLLFAAPERPDFERHYSPIVSAGLEEPAAFSSVTSPGD